MGYTCIVSLNSSELKLKPNLYLKLNGLRLVQNTPAYIYIYSIYYYVCVCALSITVTAKSSIVTLYKNEMEKCVLPTNS